MYTRELSGKTSCFLSLSLFRRRLFVSPAGICIYLFAWLRFSFFFPVNIRLHAVEIKNLCGVNAFLFLAPLIADVAAERISRDFSEPPRVLLDLIDGEHSSLFIVFFFLKRFRLYIHI